MSMCGCFRSFLILMLIFIVLAKDVIVVFNVVSLLLMPIGMKLTIVEAETMIF